MIADDLSYAAQVQVENLVLAAGYSDGNIWFETSNDDGKTKAEFGDASTRKLIASGDAQQPGICILETEEIEVAIGRAGAIYTYLSRDWGEHWSALDALS